MGDIGGTNARFALWSKDAPRQSGRVARREVADFKGPVPAIRSAVAELNNGRMPRRAILAVAGPVAARRAALTNGAWTIEAGRLESALGLDGVTLINDFAAQAHALAHYGGRDVRKLGDGRPRAGAPKVVLGPGTGLGVAAAIPGEKGSTVITGEGGHVTLPARSAREAELLALLRVWFDHVSAERVLSGDGLVHLQRAIGALDGREPSAQTPEEITARALAGACSLCVETLETFCAMLGTVAGDMALAFGAHGGVYVSGGIVPDVADAFARSRFRARFEDKGRFRDYLAAIPTYVVTHPDPALVGLRALAQTK